MIRFAARRLLQMVLVMFASSVLVFAIFNVIPNSDPAERMAGRNSTETQTAAIRKEWGFDKPVYTQYATTMKKVFSGDLQSYFTQLNVGEEIVKGIPRTLSLAVGAALLWIAVNRATDWTSKSLLIGEAVSVWAFGASWFMKGLEVDILRRRRAAEVSGGDAVTRS